MTFPGCCFIIQFYFSVFQALCCQQIEIINQFWSWGCMLKTDRNQQAHFRMAMAKKPSKYKSQGRRDRFGSQRRSNRALPVPGAVMIELGFKRSVRVSQQPWRKGHSRQREWHVHQRGSRTVCSRETVRHIGFCWGSNEIMYIKRALKFLPCFTKVKFFFFFECHEHFLNDKNKPNLISTSQAAPD